jgi:processive 1,2-diacylglycerol beta-glucosyltransferase
MPDPAPGSTLILSAGIGRGHDAVAEACATALGPPGTAMIIDCVALLGGWQSVAGEIVFRGLLSIPPAYDAFHFGHLRGGSGLATRMERASARRLVPALRAHVVAHRPARLIAVFATGAGAAGRLASEFPDISCVAVCTDATAHRIWAHPGVDRYVVFSAAAEATLRQHLPDARVARIPPPVRPAFFAHPPREAARAALGIDDQTPCALLMAGGWGLADLPHAATRLVARGYRVLGVAGANRRLADRLRALPAAKLRTGAGLTAFGFVSDVPALMAASDVVVTTAGQTVHEARVVGRPLVLLDTVPGHGRENLLLELARGGALVTQPGANNFAAVVDAARDGRAPAALEWPCATASDWDARFRAALVGLDGRGGGRMTTAPARR